MLLMPMKNKETLSKGIQTSSIALPVIIFAPILITMGFKGLKLENPIIGWVLLIIGIMTAILGMFSFSNFTQGYFMGRLNIIQRLTFLIAVPLFFLPNIVEKYFSFSLWESYAIGILIWIINIIF